MKIKKILSIILVAAVSLITLSVVNVDAVHASEYMSGTPAFLKNKTWQSGYTKYYGKGGGNTFAKIRMTFKISGDKFSGVTDFIYGGKHSVYKEHWTHLKYKKLGNGKYLLKLH